ncbi:3-hydroxyanthranilate 3,4-dioxygenase-like [Ornithodoros turicata]
MALYTMRQHERAAINWEVYSSLQKTRKKSLMPQTNHCGSVCMPHQATAMELWNNMDRWILENESYFLPPVCNKMMHKEGQLKVFFVGGPNQRYDYHIEEGEEMFYMVKGDMVLKVLERGRPKDVVIREGEVFLLPARIPHSPQRQRDTVGLVIERERAENELDCLRYYTDERCSQTLFERWMHCKNLNHDLVPVINEFLHSEEYRTKRPGKMSFISKEAYSIDIETTLEPPFKLDKWLQQHQRELSSPGSSRCLFQGKHQSDIMVFGAGTHSRRNKNYETFLWQTSGSSSVIVNNVQQCLNINDTFLVTEEHEFCFSNSTDGRTIAVSMPPL